MVKVAIYIPDYMLVLKELNSVEELAYPELVKNIDADYHYLYRVIVEMLDLGFIQKRNEGRTSYYSLTEKGTNIAIASEAFLDELDFDISRRREVYRITIPKKVIEKAEQKEKEQEPEPEPEKPKIKPEDVPNIPQEEPKKNALEELEDELVKMDNDFAEAVKEDNLLDDAEEDIEEDEFFEEEQKERDPYGEYDEDN